MLNILIHKILSLAIIMATGFLLVRYGPLTDTDTKSLSRINCYLIMPCSIFSAFQMSQTPEILRGLMLVLMAAVLVHILYIAAVEVLKKPLKLDPVEQSSIHSTNAGNLIIPLVSAMLGPEWIIYTSAFILVQTVLLWSQVKKVVCGEKCFSVRDILLNPNILAVIVGLALFLLNCPLTGMLKDTFSSVGTMIGPSSMLVIGMTMGSVSFREVLGNGRVWLTAAMRLVIFPLLCLVLLKVLCLIFPGDAQYFLVTMMAASAPSASAITPICQMYGKDPRHASAICTVTTALCTVTIPLMVHLYMGLCL